MFIYQSARILSYSFTGRKDLSLQGKRVQQGFKKVFKMNSFTSKVQYRHKHLEAAF